MLGSRAEPASPPRLLWGAPPSPPVALDNRAPLTGQRRRGPAASPSPFRAPSGTQGEAASLCPVPTLEPPLPRGRLDRLEPGPEPRRGPQLGAQLRRQPRHRRHRQGHVLQTAHVLPPRPLQVSAGGLAHTGAGRRLPLGLRQPTRAQEGMSGGNSGGHTCPSCTIGAGSDR